MQNIISTKFVALFALVALAFAAAIPAYAYDELEIELEVEGDKTQVEVEYVENGEEVEKEYEYSSTNEDEVITLLAAELGISEDDIKAAMEDESDDVVVDETMEDATEAIEEARELVTEAEAYIATIEDEDDAAALEIELETAEGYLTEAEAALAADDFDKAEEKAEMAIDLIKDIILPEYEDENEDKEDKDYSKFCDKTKKAAGWGVAKKCADVEGYEINDKLADKVDRFKDFGKSQDREVLQGQLRDLLILLIELLQMQRDVQAAADAS